MLARAISEDAPQHRFEPPQTLAQVMHDALIRGAGAAQRHPTAAGWTDLGYPDLHARVRALAHGLISLGVSPGDRVAILSRTRAEWTQADLAILFAGATLVPIYETNSADEVAYVLEHSRARVVFCEDAAQVAKLRAAEGAGAVEHAVVMEGSHPDAVTLADLIARGTDGDDAVLDAIRAATAPDDLATLVYTSGTTGPPKGCRLSQHALAVNATMVIDLLPLAPGNVFFTFLPLAHVLTRMVQLVALRVGGTLAYWSGSMDTILDDLAAIRPTHLPSVPRVFEKAQQRARQTAAEGGPVRNRIFEAATAVGMRAAARRREGRRLPPGLGLAHGAADRLVLSRVRDVFGGRVELAVCGGAPIDPSVLEFFDACGIPVLEGYGMTETSAVTTLNPLEGRRFGTVGPALPGCEVRIADDGEILLKGPNLFAGYDGDPAGTAETLRDGWLYTGDLGTLDPDGYLRLIGRKKEIVVTSSGKNVSPANIELALTASPWISQAVVHGDRRPYLVALLALDPVEAPRMARELGVDAGDPVGLAADERVQAELAKVVAAVNARFAPIEQVKRFHLLGRELNQPEGEVTASLKIKRGLVQERYASAFARLYGDSRGTTDVWIERDRSRTPQSGTAAS
ncbi:MAG: Long-chain-fatty-acid--CoA ligase [uncultured Solirubrobacteraceae bacterium]|uniref:Acyl-CoA synthetase n=1 Tax=uncultured Solirubrobacteraceae bacterium TaxID=1162706 RepID=A0A6J4RLA4_9ACTN|nr:MAG: Long-chain-fatty-acid--CoA ligase [uncultured Solirubrobacteraceae bacterium]